MQQPGISDAEIIEMIDIGGPSMLRAAAKNFQRVTAVSDPKYYDEIIGEMDANAGEISLATKQKMATETFANIHQYDADISHWFKAKQDDDYAAFASAPIPAGFELAQVVRYGENPHQIGALFSSSEHKGLASAKQRSGKQMSWNNYTDLSAAWQLVQAFDETACTIIKHANPCGVAHAQTQPQAFAKALQTDTTSAFGGIIAFNTPLEVETAKAIIAFGFVEVVVAPQIDAAAQAVFEKRKNVRLLTLEKNQSQWRMIGDESTLMVQSSPTKNVTEDWKCVTKLQPTVEQLADAHFSWKVCKTVKSNAIVYAKNGMTIGVGAGQMSRIFSAKIGQMKAQDAGLSVIDCAMASDAFFPFTDSIEEASKAGVSIIVQPGGSIRDEEVIAAADEHGICMMFTGTRYFLH